MATAYSPQDSLDAAYRATKGRDLYLTAGRVSDVRFVPYGVAAPQPGADPPLPPRLTIPLRTLVIVPLGHGYLDHTPGHDSDGEARVFLVDDTGSEITRETRQTGVVHVDLRMRTEAEALAYNGGAGRASFRIFVITGRAPADPVAPHEDTADDTAEVPQWVQLVATLLVAAALYLVLVLLDRR